MSELVPNLVDLIKALPANSPARAIVAVFDGPDLESARRAMRTVVDGWEQEAENMWQRDA